MLSLFDLPVAPVIKIFLDFFTIEDLRLLDIAMCSCIFRKAFHDVIQNPSFVVCDKMIGSLLIHEKLHWMLRRNIRVQSVCTFKELPIQSLCTYTCFECTEKVLMSSANSPQLHLLANKLVKLKYLDVRPEYDISGALFHRIPAAIFDILAQHCPRLEVLRTPLVTDLPDASILLLADCCPNLSSVWLQELTDLSFSALGMLAKSCSKLCEVDLSYSNVGDEHVSVLAKNAPNLTVLHLAETHVTDKGLVDLTKCCRRLTLLSLKDCAKISDVGVARIANSVFAATLARLYLTRCYEVSDVSMELLLRNCKELRTIALGYTQIADPTVLALSQNCVFLQRAILNNTRLSNIGVMALAENCKKLEFLSLSETEIDDSALLIHPFSALKEIHLSGCLNVSEDGVLAVLGNSPNLRAIGLYNVPGVNPADLAAEFANIEFL